MSRPHLPIHLAGASTCAVLLLVIYAVAIGPALATDPGAAVDEAHIIQGRLSMQQLEHTVTQLRRQLATLNQELDAAPLDIERVANANRRLAALNRLADERGLTVDAIEIGPPREAEHYQVVPIEFTGSGTFTDAVRFIADLHAQMGDIAVQSMELGATVSEGPGTARLVADLAWYAVRGDQPER
ncbi:MAG: type 4a pilus biogenesis protein PilO [Phycisphaerales bacterium]|nr:type 4a pilus biogenesis protein PilO [Phycisphaerales bacterium]